MEKKIKTIRIILWLIFLIILAGLLYLKIIPTGNIVYNYDFKKNNYFIKKITPVERLEIMNNGRQRIIGEPVYFSLFTPRRFNEAKVILNYKIDGQENFIPIIELGVLNDKTIWRYDLQPIDNGVINKISKSWDKIESDGVIFLQRNMGNIKKFNSAEEYIKNLPDYNQVALYNYDLKNNFKISGYKADKIYVNKINFSIRSNYQFYTYIKDEDLDFDFKFKDINKNKDRDPVEVNLYYKNELIDTRRLNDEGIDIEESGKVSSKHLKFKVPGLPEGDYKIEVKTNDDIITDEIISPQTKISFINKIRFSGGENETTLFTDSQKIQFETTNPGSVQKIKINNDSLDIDKTYKQFSWFSAFPFTELVLEKGDITVSGNGLFSFAKDQLFNPEIKKLNDTFNMAQSEINYIIAKYKIPEKQDEWRRSEAKFDLTKAYRENGNYNFLISATGLESEKENQNSIILDNIKIELSGSNITSYFKKAINKLK